MSERDAGSVVILDAAHAHAELNGCTCGARVWVVVDGRGDVFRVLVIHWPNCPVGGGAS